MTKALLIISTVFSLLSGMDSNKDKMTYTELYESGYYAEVIAILSDTADTIIVDDAELENRKKILAFSLILFGMKDAAIEVFWSMLDKNHSFNLDPILTSPKIYEVFSETRRLWNEAFAANAALKHSPITDLALRGRILLPFGTGQYVTGNKKKGIIFSIIQAGALGGSVWAYDKRNSYYDPQYGWYNENRDEMNYYTNIMRVQFGIFVAAYIWSVVDAYLETPK